MNEFLKMRCKLSKLQHQVKKLPGSLPGLDNISRTACYLCLFVNCMEGKLNKRASLIVTAEL